METTADDQIVDRNDRLALERERQELAKKLFARGLISAVGLERQLEVRVVDLVSEEPLWARSTPENDPG